MASDPTLSRTIHRLADDVDAVLPAIDRARALARARVWGKAGKDAPDHQVDARRPLIIDVDATLVTAHSDKEQARPTFKRGFGFHPLCAFADQTSGAGHRPLRFALIRRRPRMPSAYILRTSTPEALPPRGEKGPLTCDFTCSGGRI